jgi:hypothetical protein
LIDPKIGDKIGDIMRIKGEIESFEEKLMNVKGIKHLARFKNTIEYFKCIKKYLENFEI